MSGTQICETVTATRMANLRARRDKTPAAEMVELRLDGVRDLDVAGALEGRTKPVVVTCRPVWEGGQFDGSEEERLRILARALALGADHVDVEWRADRSTFQSVDRSRLILSLHDLDGAPDDLTGLVRSMRAAHAGMIKIAVTARRLGDCVALRDAVRDDPAHVAIALGAKGLISRAMPAAFGSRWIYAGSAAPGQLSARALSHVFRVNRTTAGSAVYAVAGRPAAFAAAIAMHNAAFVDLGLDAVCVPLETDDAGELASVCSAFGVRGASLTAPLKTQMVHTVDVRSVIANRVHAIDSIRLTAAGFEGENFEVSSFLTPFDRRSFRLRKVRALVVGAGAAARAAATALKAHGAHVLLCARRADEAAAVARKLGVKTDAWPPSSPAELVIVATGGDLDPVVHEAIAAIASKAELVFDVSCRCPETPVLASARQAGVATIGGLEMLCAQVRRQLYWWTTRDTTLAVLERAAMEAWTAPPQNGSSAS